MRFQIQMLLVAAICAVLFHGALSAPSPSNFDDDDLMLRSDNDDNEDPDQNPILIYLAKKFIKKVGCKAAMKYATKKCGVPQPTTAAPQERSPADAEDDDELDQSMLLVAAMCAVLFHGAFSAPSPSSNFHDEDLMLRSDNADEESDQNPILILIAKLFVKKVGCAVAKKYVTEKCGVRELPIPLEALERLPADAVEDELDQRMLLVAALCAVLFQGAFSAPSPSNVDNVLRSASDDEDTDENPLLILAAKILVKQVGCAVAKRHAASCGVRELPIPLEALERLPADAVEDELDQSIADILRRFGCRAARFISRFC
uniref:Secreted protein n=1 Tax=Daphnia galeata TaxID=27404 RepID=A0A8J2RGJ0_9CRUS|nr:unnamed protein product [Daphnia galeata]